jgi:integrase
MAKTLTAISIEKLKPGTERREIPDPGARGLYVVVQPSGTKSFAVRYRYGGVPKKLTLQPGISLAAARKAAADALFEVQQGRDPAEIKKAAQAKAVAARADTLRAVAEEYLNRERDKLRTIDQRRATFERLIFPKLGARPIAEIKRSEIVRLLDQVEDERGGRMADEVLATLRKLMGWHAARDDEFKSPIVRGMARTKPKERARKRILSDDEIRLVWTAAAAMSGPFGAFIQFTLLTATRRNEAADISRSELVGDDWLIPAARYKGKHDHLIPVSAAAQAVLARLPKIAGCEYIFSTDGKRSIGGFSKFKAAFDKVCGVTDWRLHDLRRSARSLMSRAGVPTDHAERALGHVIGGVRETYDRYEYRDEKKQAFEALAAQLVRIVDPVDNVVPVRGRR